MQRTFTTARGGVLRVGFGGVLSAVGARRERGLLHVLRAVAGGAAGGAAAATHRKKNA